MTNPVTRQIYQTPYAVGDLFGSSMFWRWETERQHDTVADQCSGSTTTWVEDTLPDGHGFVAVDGGVVLPIYRCLVEST